MTNFVRFLGICKIFAGNRVNKLGNVPRCGVVPRFSDLEVFAFGITAGAFGLDSENLLFHRLHYGCKNDFARAKRFAMGRDNLDAAPGWGYCASQGMRYCGYKRHAVCRIRGVIHSYGMTAASVHGFHCLKDVQWEYHDSMMIGDKGYLGVEVQMNLFEAANILKYHTG